MNQEKQPHPTNRMRSKKQPHPKKGMQPNGIKKQNTLLRYQTTNTHSELALSDLPRKWSTASGPPSYPRFGVLIDCPVSAARDNITHRGGAGQTRVERSQTASDLRKRAVWTLLVAWDTRVRWVTLKPQFGPQLAFFCPCGPARGLPEALTRRSAPRPRRRS